MVYVVVADAIFTMSLVTEDNNEIYDDDGTCTLLAHD